MPTKIRHCDRKDGPFHPNTLVKRLLAEIDNLVSTYVDRDDPEAAAQLRIIRVTVAQRIPPE
jgi:hypothetical protein